MLKKYVFLILGMIMNRIMTLFGIDVCSKYGILIVIVVGILLCVIFNIFMKLKNRRR